MYKATAAFYIIVPIKINTRIKSNENRIIEITGH